MEQNTKNDPKKAIFQNFVKQKSVFFLMSQGSFSRKIRFLGQMACSDKQTQKWKQKTPFQGFRIFSNFPSTYHQGVVQQVNDILCLFNISFRFRFRTAFVRVETTFKQTFLCNGLPIITKWIGDFVSHVYKKWDLS